LTISTSSQTETCNGSSSIASLLVVSDPGYAFLPFTSRNNAIFHLYICIHTLPACPPGRGFHCLSRSHCGQAMYVRMSYLFLRIEFRMRDHSLASLFADQRLQDDAEALPQCANTWEPIYCMRPDSLLCWSLYLISDSGVSAFRICGAFLEATAKGLTAPVPSPTNSTMSILLLSFYLVRQGVEALPISALDDQQMPSSACNDTNSRTLWSIIWSCLVTILSCTWVSIHPNIPGPNESWFKIGCRRMRVMFVGLIAPELIIYWALKQWISARRIAEIYRGVPLLSY
jgi:hypothetical protein